MIYLLLEYFLEGNYGYQHPLFRATFAILIAFAVVLLLGRTVIKRLIRMRLGDIPDFDHKALNELTQHKANIPTMGGLLILFGISAAVFL
ncbi:MAG: phospho-N-acetylmuramoyl-pentapeptide-transferase, partial [Planctomycetota bacterium]